MSIVIKYTHKNMDKDIHTNFRRVVKSVLKGSGKLIKWFFDHMSISTFLINKNPK